MNNNGNNLLAFVVGVTVGTVVGVLYAPDKGKNTRDKLSYQLDKYQESLQNLIDGILENKDILDNEARSEGQKVVADVEKQAQKLMSEFDALKKQLSSPSAN